MNLLVGVFGAAKYAAAIASGDIASEEVTEQRREVCRACPSRVRKSPMPGVAESDWCGSPMEETEKTCGCLLFAATMVASKECPQKKWLATERAPKSAPYQRS